MPRGDISQGRPLRRFCADALLLKLAQKSCEQDYEAVSLEAEFRITIAREGAEAIHTGHSPQVDAPVSQISE